MAERLRRPLTFAQKNAIHNLGHRWKSFDLWRAHQTQTGSKGGFWKVVYSLEDRGLVESKHNNFIEYYRLTEFGRRALGGGDDR